MGQDDAVTTNDEQLFLAHIQKNPINGKILQLAPYLGVSDWWLTAGALFQELGVEVEVRNEARVHLWYEEHFGVSAIPFTSTTDAINHFAAKTCCFAVTSDEAGNLTTYAPHGYKDLYARKIVPNPVLAPQEVYETKTKRWTTQWPSLTAMPWPTDLSVNEAPTPSTAPRGLPS